MLEFSPSLKQRAGSKYLAGDPDRRSRLRQTSPTAHDPWPATSLGLRSERTTRQPILRDIERTVGVVLGIKTTSLGYILRQLFLALAKPFNRRQGAQSFPFVGRFFVRHKSLLAAFVDDANTRFFASIAVLTVSTLSLICFSAQRKTDSNIGTRESGERRNCQSLRALSLGNTSCVSSCPSRLL